MTDRLRVAVRRALRIAAPSQWAARLVVLLAPFVVVLAAATAGAEVPRWSCSWCCSRPARRRSRPDTHAVGATLLVLLVFWWWSGPAASDGPVLLAAAGVVALHVAGTLAGYAPAATGLDAGLVRLWLQRAGLLWLVAVLAWGARRVADAGALDTVLGLVLLAAVCWWAALPLRPHPAAREVRDAGAPDRGVRRAGALAGRAGAAAAGSRRTA